MVDWVSHLGGDSARKYHSDQLVSECMNFLFSKIETPKSNPTILKTILRIQGSKTVLETVLRLLIESIVFEEIALENITAIGQKSELKS